MDDHRENVLSLNRIIFLTDQLFDDVNNKRFYLELFSNPSKEINTF